jgi:hypothetical protein
MVLDTSDCLGALLFWCGSAVTSIERVVVDLSSWVECRDGDHLVPPLTSEFDGAFAILALRNVLRAAEWSAWDLNNALDDFDVRPFIAEFKNEVPGLVNARDALEHFDEYAVGRGRLQKTVPGFYLFDLVLEDGRPVGKVGPLNIDLESAMDACRRLAVHLLARAEIENPDRAETLLDEILAESAGESANRMTFAVRTARYIRRVIARTGGHTPSTAPGAAHSGPSSVPRRIYHSVIKASR